MRKILDEATELEQKNTAEIAQEAAPALEYEEIFEPAPASNSQTEFKVQVVRKKSRAGGIMVLATLIAVAGFSASVYMLEASESTSGLAGLGVQNITDIPQGAVVPAFRPIDPLEFTAAHDDDSITVPDETGLELPAFGHGPQVAPERINYTIQQPHVSAFFARAAQDETYVYFLQDPVATTYSLYNLKRANPSTGKTEPAINSSSQNIYSFALYGYNIITCEYKPATDSFAFYRNPKSGEHAQMLFETASPAYMNVFDDKLFLLFVEEQALGVFDFAADTEPSYIALEPLAETTHYFPQFSVINGYLYYGVWHDTDADGQAQQDYFRRSLYTGETIMLLNAEYGNSIWNPCWDADGTAYYLQHDAEAMEFNIAAIKDGGSPQIISAVNHNQNWPQLLAFKDEFLIAALPTDILRQYALTDFSIKLEVAVESQPFAVTKDYLVTNDGLYRLFDFGFISYSS